MELDPRQADACANIQDICRVQPRRKIVMETFQSDPYYTLVSMFGFLCDCDSFLFRCTPLPTWPMENDAPLFEICFRAYFSPVCRSSCRKTYPRPSVKAQAIIVCVLFVGLQHESRQRKCNGRCFHPAIVDRKDDHYRNW